MNYKDNAKLVREHLEMHELNFEEQEFEGFIVFILKYTDSDSFYSQIVHEIRVEDEMVYALMTFPVSAKAKMAEIVEFVTRINYGLKLGKFQVDYSDGEIRFCYTESAEGLNAASEAVTTRLVLVPVKMNQWYGRGIAELLLGSCTPEEAIKHCEV